MPRIQTDKMKKALMRSNTRLLLSAVMLFQALAMLLVAFQSGAINRQALVLAARVLALAKGAYHVSREDIAQMAYPVLRHRIRLNFDAVTENKTADELIGNLIEELRPRHGFFAR